MTSVRDPQDDMLDVKGHTKSQAEATSLDQSFYVPELNIYIQQNEYSDAVMVNQQVLPEHG
jgi:hypothetical protein